MASFDPRALLDPKSRAKDKSKKRAPNYGPTQTRKPSTPQASAAEKTTPMTMSAAPPQISFAFTNGEGDPTASTSSAHADPAGETPGMLSLLERQHNLSNREAPPAKRRRVEQTEDMEDEAPKSTTTKGASNGELGEHLREEREKAAASNPGPAAIDLTNDDDDDVQILSSKTVGPDNNELVCLGMLQANATVHHIPRYSRAKVPALSKDHYPMMRVNPVRSTAATNNIIDLYDRGGTAGDKKANKFGKVEVKAAITLCSMLDYTNITGFQMRVFLDSTPKKPNEYEMCKVSRLMSLRILLFARRGKADGIGVKLSQNNMWLAKPTAVPLERDMPLFNPQAPPGTLTNPQPSSKRAGQGGYGIVRTQEEMIRETNSMFDNLLQTGEIPEMGANDDVIRTQLQGMQKQALHFLTQHEQPGGDSEAQPSLSLWKPRETRKGTVFANVITNHELPQQPEPVRGGILADEMGLGKTLSILALHASTLAEAKAFGEAEAPIDLEEIACNAKATLVVCPNSVITNWAQQIKEHTLGLKVYQYHGSNRTQDLDELSQYDVVLTPYGTVAAEYNNQNSSRNALSAINWFRIVLDEAHHIRNPSAKVSKACCALTAQRRWAVTGTPVQNRLDDLGTLMKFLRVKPFDEEANWARHIMAPFKSADENVLKHLQLLVASVTLRRTKEKVGLPQRIETRFALEFSGEERAMYAQFSGQANLAVKRIMGNTGRIQGKGYAFMLRSIHRLRAICAHGQEMLSDDDLKELEGLTAQTAIDLGDEPDESGEPDRNFITESQAYDFLHMMIESDGDICTGCGKKLTSRETEDTDSSEELSADDDYNEDNDPDVVAAVGTRARDALGYINPCYDHLICPSCTDDYVRGAQEKKRVDGYHECPYCNQYVRFGLFELRRSAYQSFLESKSPKNKKQRTKWDESTYSGPHTKVKALIDELKQTAMQSEMLSPSEPPYKSVIFSGWTTYLDLIEYALDEHDIRHIRLDGSMSIKQRTKVLDDFRSDDDITVILISIRAGGQGLNLTSASKVYMMEPQFNPGVEQQAIDRVHRIGQKREVEIKHFIMKDSIEEKIQKMQERKQKLARLAMEKKLSRDEAAKRRAEELSELFK